MLEQKPRCLESENSGDAQPKFDDHEEPKCAASGYGVDLSDVH